MKLDDLKKQIPYKWRVQSFSKFKAQAACVAYIDARDVMDMLDNVCGPEHWQDDYKLIDGKLFAGIGININDKWVWKWDTGTESNIEKEKGQSSDAFKRAAVKWGVGRFLYSLDIVYLQANETKKNNNYPYVIDNKGKRIYDITKYINSLKKQPATTKTATDFIKLFDKSKGLEDLERIWKENASEINAMPKEERDKAISYCKQIKEVWEREANENNE